MQNPTQQPSTRPINQPFPPVSNPGSDDTTGLEQEYQKNNPEKGEELNEFTNTTDSAEDRDEDYEQTESTINESNRKFPDDDSNIGDNPIYPDSDEVIAGGSSTADPHSDRSFENRDDDNPQDVDETDDESIDAALNIDERGGGDGEIGGDDDDDSDDDIVTSIGR